MSRVLALICILYCTLAGCRHAEPPVEGALYSCDNITVWPDSLLTEGHIIRPQSLDTFPNALTLSSDGDSLLTYYFNRASATPIPQFSPQYNRQLDPLINPSYCIARAHFLLDSIDSSASLSYPIVNRPIAAVAQAIAVANATGDHRLTSRIVTIARRIIDNDRRIKFCDSLGLFTGIDPLTLSQCRLPRWFDPMAMAASVSFASNVDYAIALDFLAKAESTQSIPHGSGLPSFDYSSMRDSLVNAIDTYLWIPDKGRFSRLIQGYPTPAQAENYDLEAMARYALSGVALDPIVKSMTDHSQAQDLWVPPYFAAYNHGYSNEPSMDWGIVASRTADEALLSAALAYAMLNAHYAPPYQALRRLVVGAIFGIDTSSATHLSFAPMVPQALSGNISLTNLLWRDAIIDINLHGHGNIISTFAIDGSPSSVHSISDNLSGHHTIDITLAGSDQQIRTLTESVNSPSALILPHPQQPAYTDSIVVRFTDIARPYARSLRDKKLSHTYVESTRYRNKSIPVEINVDRDCDAMVTFSFINGEGIVNPDRRYSLRTLRVNNTADHLVVFSQLTPDDWRHDLDWQTSVGVTPPLRIHLRQGINTLSLDYFAPDIPGFNHDANTLIPLSLTIHPLNP